MEIIFICFVIGMLIGALRTKATYDKLDPGGEDLSDLIYDINPASDTSFEEWLRVKHKINPMDFR